MKKLINVLAVTGLILFYSQNIWTCTCGVNTVPCSEYAESEAVFIGKVIDIKTVKGFPPTRIEIEVIKSYKGVNTKSVYALTGATSCDFESYKVGKTFLLYGSLGKEDKFNFSTSYCSRSTEYKEDLIDLKFLNSINNSIPFYLISGSIQKNDANLFERVKAEVRSNNKKTFASSDENGNFSINVSKEGKYKVTIFPPLQTMLDFSALYSSNFISEHNNKILKDYKFDGKSGFVTYDIEVKANNCGWFFLPLEDYRKDEEN